MVVPDRNGRRGGGSDAPGAEILHFPAAAGPMGRMPRENHHGSDGAAGFFPSACSVSSPGLSWTRAHPRRSTSRPGKGPWGKPSTPGDRFTPRAGRLPAC